MIKLRGRASYTNHVCFPGGDGSGAMTFLDNSRPDFFCALNCGTPITTAGRFRVARHRIALH